MPQIQINNCQYFYEEYGKGKETILFSHGLLLDHTMFISQINHFKSKYRIIAYDHRGQGKSEVTDSGYDMDQLFLDAVTLIEKLKLGKVHFVGLSMGGFVGMRLAARRPDLVQSLVLMDTSAEEEPNKLKYSMLSFIVRLFGTKAVANRVMNIMYGQKALHDPKRKSERESWKHSLESLDKSIIKSVKGVIDRDGVVDELENITCPTLVLVGDQDVATIPSKSKLIHSKIKGSEFKLITGAGHSSSIEEPEQVIQILETFWKTKS